MMNCFYLGNAGSIAEKLSPRQDLTFAQLGIYYQAVSIMLDEDYKRNLGFYTSEGKFNYLAYLLADVNNVSIKVARYLGTDKADLIRYDEFGYCSLIKATHSVLDKIDVYNETSSKITYPYRIEKRLVERDPVREALINAMIHCDYSMEVPPVVEVFSNRLEITSYGRTDTNVLFGGISLARNPQLMRVFKELGFSKGEGSGIKRILCSYDKSVFRRSGVFLRVVFPFADAVS